MEGSYYVRLRGRVSGPFSTAQLRAMRQRGQLGRFHEISPDMQNWSPAATFAELFEAPASGSKPLPGSGSVLPAPPASLPYPMQQPPAPAPLPEFNVPLPPAPAPVPATPASAVEEWYYLDLTDQRHGPFTLEFLTGLYDSGRLPGDTPVWKAGLAEWANLGDIARTSVARAVVADYAQPVGGPVAGDWAGWQKFHLAIILILAGMGTLIGACVLSVIAYFMMRSGSIDNLGVVQTLAYLSMSLWFLSAILDAVGSGLCLAVPGIPNGKLLGSGMLVLAVFSPLLALLMLLLLLSAESSLSLFELILNLRAILFLAIIRYLLGCSWYLVWLLLLREVAGHIRQPRTVTGLTAVLVGFGVLFLVQVVSSIVAYSALKSLDESSPKLLRVLDLLNFILSLAWSVWYLIVLVDFRATLRRVVRL